MKPMPRNDQVSRIYAVLGLLEGAPHGLTVAEIWERLKDRDFEASKRTLYRDLEALSQAGFPLYSEGEETTQRWLLQRTTKIGQYLILSPRELVSLYLARGALTPLRDTPFYEDLTRVFNKIKEKLGEKGREYLETLGDEMRFEPGPRWGLGLDPDLLETVRACCAESQVLAVGYRSTRSQALSARRLGPHYLYFSKGSLYLVAEDLGDQQVKVFSLARMSDAVMVDEPYAGEPVLPEKMFEHSFGVFRGGTPVDVKIEFSSAVGPYVRERRWHQSQSVVSHKSGSIEVCLHVAITPDFVNWVLSFGAEARVVEPSLLRDQVVEAAQRVVKVYAAKKKAA